MYSKIRANDPMSLIPLVKHFATGLRQSSTIDSRETYAFSLRIIMTERKKRKFCQPRARASRKTRWARRKNKQGGRKSHGMVAFSNGVAILGPYCEFITVMTCAESLVLCGGRFPGVSSKLEGIGFLTFLYRAGCQRANQLPV